MANTVKTLVKTKDLIVDEKLNLLVMRDTPDAVRMAERLVAAQDLAEAEVMLEVEVLEVGTNVLQELGIRYPEQFSYSIVGSGGTPGTVTLPEWHNRDSSLVRLTVSNPFLILNLKNETGKSNLLANPRIRVKSKEKAKIHIGDKVPVITNTSTATGLVSESVNYLDVGLKLDVEPTVTLDDEVGIKIGLEVSSIVREVRTTAGALTYQLGTRNASTSLRLKDGETQVLAGLISEEDRKTANQIPGLGDLPVIGRLFGSHLDTTNKTEIVLLITPRIVRNIARPDIRMEQFASGTEGAIGVPPLVLQSLPLSGGPAAAARTAPPSTLSGRLLLTAPSSIGTEQEFTLVLSSEMAAGLKGGLIDVSFDAARLQFVRAEPSPALAAQDASFRSNAPAGVGKLAISFSTKAEVPGTSELTRIIFRAAGQVTGTPTVQVTAASLTEASGKLVSAELPPPVALSLTP
jgi:general secretion pathway protein D